jgi:hypothetical protein
MFKSLLSVVQGDPEEDHNLDENDDQIETDGEPNGKK